MALKHASGGRSAELSHEALTMVEADEAVRPLKDWIVIEPLDAVYSTQIYIQHQTKPLRGIVKAVGPGRYPKRYNDTDKHRRTKMWDAKVFRPTEVKVGQTVELGGLEHGGYSFQSFYWGSVLHILAREEDVAGIVEDDHPNQQVAVA